jgi:hypothetical protein
MIRKASAQSVSASPLKPKADPRGVLSKPDTVDPQETEIWEKIMKGNSHRLRLGYYMTRLPKSDPKEMKMKPDEARTMEHKFFNGHAIWGRMDKEHLGSSKLADALSRALSKMIQDMYRSP